MPVAPSVAPGLIRRGWKRLFGGSRPEPVLTTIHDIQVGVAPGVNTQGAKLPKTKQKPVILSYESKQFRAGFAEPEYNLAEIFKAMDTESYMRLAFDKHEELILKGKWGFKGQNPATRSYVMKRLHEISWSQNEPLERIIEAGIEDLVESSNVFYVLARKEGEETYRSRFGRNLAPITGIFSPNSAGMKPFIRTSKRGVREITNWHQVTGGRVFKKFKPYNVVHMPFRKKKGHIFGTPFPIPVLDDILALRRIEELVEVLVHKHAFPFFHYKVGTETEDAREYDDGHSEVNDVRAEIANMPFEGGLVTPYRHEIVVLGTKNKAVNAEPYVQYYEARVLSGLNLSGIDIGRGETANRATAQTMSKGLSDRCTRFQEFFSWYFTYFILDELVLEMGELPIPENRVYLVFQTIDQEERRAHENHSLALYQGGLLDEDEARIEISRDPVTDEQRKRMHFEILEKKLAEVQADNKEGIGGVKATANREQPENKSKKSTSKPTVAANMAAIAALQDCIADHRSPILSSLGGLDNFMDVVDSYAEKHIYSWMAEGCQRLNNEIGTRLYVGTNIQDGFVDDFMMPRLKYLREDFRKKLERSTTIEDRAAVADLYTMHVTSAFNQLAFLAENYAYARMAQVAKYKHVQWGLGDVACEDCKGNGPFKIKRFKPGDLFYHDKCMTQLEVADSR